MLPNKVTFDLKLLKVMSLIKKNTGGLGGRVVTLEKKDANYNLKWLVIMSDYHIT